MDTIQLPTPLVVNKKGFEITQFPSFSPSLYDGLNHDQLVKAFVRNMSFALVTENFEEYEKHLDYMFALFSQNGIVRTDISLKIFNECTHLRSINAHL